VLIFILIFSPITTKAVAITEMIAPTINAEWKPPFIASIEGSPIFSRVSV